MWFYQDRQQNCACIKKPLVQVSLPMWVQNFKVILLLFKTWFWFSHQPEPYFETHIYACGSIEFCIFPFVIFQSNGASLLFLLQESLVTMSMSKTHSIIQRWSTVSTDLLNISWYQPGCCEKLQCRNVGWSACLCNWKCGRLLCLCKASRSSLQSSSSQSSWASWWSSW